MCLHRKVSSAKLKVIATKPVVPFHLSFRPAFEREALDANSRGFRHPSRSKTLIRLQATQQRFDYHLYDSLVHGAFAQLIVRRPFQLGYLNSQSPSSLLLLSPKRYKSVILADVIFRF